MPVTCSDYCERGGGGSVFRTSEPSSKSVKGVKLSRYVLKHPHLTSRTGLLRTLNALLSRQLPDQNTRKIVACFTAGNNKTLFICKGTKHLLGTFCAAEKRLTIIIICTHKQDVCTTLNVIGLMELE